MTDLWPYLVMILVGFLPNEVWRMLGVLVARNVDEGSELLVWVRAVATAVLAGVVAQLVVVPPGALATSPAFVRYSAMAAGFVGFLAIRRSVFIGVVIGEAVLVFGTWFYGS